MRANGNNYGGKAIWVISGKNTVIDSIEFSLCACVDNNGAGIRQQGANLTVRHCYFHDNQEGILAGDDTASDILIEYSEFRHNGAGDGYSHNLYINHVHSLTFQYNYSHQTRVGHELKSRAWNNYILYNRIANEDTGTASRCIDLPNGGICIVMGNEIEQGPLSQNSNIMEFGLEGLTNPINQFYVINNTIVNDRGNGSFIDLQTGTPLCKAWNNIIAGPGSFIIGSGTIDTTDNLICPIANAGLVNTSAYDYHLLSSSPAINNAANAGAAPGFSLTPTEEYEHPLTGTPRKVVGALDIGAHEYGIATGVENIAYEIPAIYPNPSTGQFTVEMPAGYEKAKISLWNINGQIVYCSQVHGKEQIIDKENLPVGIYTLKIETIGNSVNSRVVIQR